MNNVILDTKCPFCERNRKRKVNKLIPRELFDCACGAVLEVWPIKEVLDGRGFAWALDWEER